MPRLPAKGFGKFVGTDGAFGGLELVEKTLKGVCAICVGFFFGGGNLVYSLRESVYISKLH